MTIYFFRRYCGNLQRKGNNKHVVMHKWWLLAAEKQMESAKLPVPHPIASPHHVSFTLQCLGLLPPWLCPPQCPNEDVCGMNFSFAFLFCSPPFITLDFGSDHFDLILSFDSLRWSFAMPVAYNRISVMAGEVFIATRKRLNLTMLRNPSCTVSQCAATHSDISGGLPCRISSLIPQNSLGSQAVSS